MTEHFKLWSEFLFQKQLLIYIYHFLIQKICIYRSFINVAIVVVWQLDLQLHMQSVSISTNVVSANCSWRSVSIQHYVIKFVNDLRQICLFSLGTPVSSTNKTDLHDIAEILLKVALNTLTLNSIINVFIQVSRCKI